MRWAVDTLAHLSGRFVIEAFWLGLVPTSGLSLRDTSPLHCVGLSIQRKTSINKDLNRLSHGSSRPVDYVLNASLVNSPKSMWPDGHIAKLQLCETQSRFETRALLFLIRRPSSI